MKLYIFTLLLLSVLPTLAQQQDEAQDREVRRAERAAYWGSKILQYDFVYGSSQSQPILANKFVRGRH